MPEEEKVKRGSVGSGERSELGSVGVTALLQLAPGIRHQASAFPPQPVAPVSRQEALNSHVNEHLDPPREPPHPLAHPVTFAEQIQINSKVIHGTP